MELTLAEHSLHTYSLPYTRPVRWSDIVEDAGQFLLLRITAQSGHTGVAEITIKPTWTGASLPMLSAAIDDILMPRLRNIELSNVEQIRAVLDGIPENHAAKALIDNALWDLYASYRDQPLWKLWQGRQTVPLSWAVTRQAPVAMAAEAAEYVNRYGFSTLKIKGGQGISTDVRALREIRNAVGGDVILYVDANGAYSPSEAAEYASSMADAGAQVVEDPCPLVPGAEFRKLQANSPVPVLVDFGCRSRRDALLFMESDARAISLKPGRFGLSDTKAMAATANDMGVRTVTGLFGESLLGTFTALQLSATLPETALAAEVTWFLSMTNQIVNIPFEIRNGMATLPDIAGTASFVDWQQTQRITR